MSVSLAKIEAIVKQFEPLIELRDTMREYAAVSGEVVELRAKKKSLEDDISVLETDKSNANAEVLLSRSEAKAIEDRAQDDANKLIADAKLEASIAVSRAKGDAEAILEDARSKVAEHEAKVKTLESVVAKLTADTEAAEAVEARLAKAKESIAKLLG
jgi:chromosome segregation ATPase